LGVGAPDLPSKPTCVRASFEVCTVVSLRIPFFSLVCDDSE